MRSMYGIALPETNSNFAPENFGIPLGSLEIPDLESASFLAGRTLSF